MSEDEIRRTIVGFFQEHRILKDAKDEDDIFDLGVSSLAVVEMQISIEQALDVTVSTGDLMRAPTVNGWVALYKNELQERAAARSAVAS